MGADGHDVEVGEFDAVGGEAVEVGGADLVVAVAADVAEALVVGHDEEDVGLRACRGPVPCAGASGEGRRGGAPGGGSEELASSEHGLPLLVETVDKVRIRDGGAVHKGLARGGRHGGDDGRSGQRLSGPT